MFYKWRATLGYVMFLILLVPILGLAYLGHFSRFMADDYSSAMIAQSKGILGGTVHWYINWTGRYSANFLDSVMGYIGPGGTPYSAPVIIVVWLLVVVLLMKQFKPLHVAAPAGAIILLSTLSTTPTIEQSVFWGQGMRSVIPPLILATGYAGLLLHRLRQSLPQNGPGWLLFSASTAFISAGFSETCAVVQLSFVGLVAATWVVYSKVNLQVLYPLAAYIIGSVSGILVTIAAPGNKIRQAYYPPPPAIKTILEIAYTSMKIFFEKYLLSGPSLTILAAVLFFFTVLGTDILTGAKNGNGRMSIKKVSFLLLLPALTALLLFLSFVPAAYGMSSAPPERTLIIPTFILVCALATWASLSGQLLNKLLPDNLIVYGLLISTFFTSVGYIPQLLINITDGVPVYKTYAEYWDSVDSSLRHAKESGVQQCFVAVLPNWARLEDITSDSSHWTNESVSKYYGLTVVAQ